MNKIVYYFRWYFPRAEVKAVLNSLREESRKFSRNFAFERIKFITEACIRDPYTWSFTKNALKSNSPEAVWLTLMAIVCESEIRSGRFHVYRGVVNMEGESIMALHAIISAHLGVKKAWSGEQYVKNRMRIKSFMKEAG